MDVEGVPLGRRRTRRQRWESMVTHQHTQELRAQLVERSGVRSLPPPGTGKTTWLKQRFPNAIYLDLLDHALYLQLLSAP